MLEAAGLDFDVTSVDVDETETPGLEPLAVVDELALRKLEACPELLDQHLVLTADTLVFVGAEILAKPADEVEARKMLEKLAGKEHYVTTSVCLGYQNKVHQFNVTTLVYFNKLSAPVIDYYIENYKPYDKAGSYGIQEWIGLVGISRINGSYTNVVGLPVAETFNALVEVSRKWKIN